MMEIMKFPFGKHQGKPINEIPRDYLAWALEKATSLDEEQREAIAMMLSASPGRRGTGGHQPYCFGSVKELMLIAYRAGNYGGKPDLLKITMQGAFEGWSCRSSETWEHRFFVEFRIPGGNFESKHPEQFFTAQGETLEQACAKILAAYRQANEEKAA